MNPCAQCAIGSSSTVWDRIELYGPPLGDPMPLNDSSPPLSAYGIVLTDIRGSLLQPTLATGPALYSPVIY